MDDLSFDIRVAYPGFTLQVAESIPLDGVTALTGPSGSGKTSLLRVLSGLENGGQAQIRFGDEVWDQLPAHRRGIGFVFQDARLFDHLDVAGNLNYGAKRRGVDDGHVSAVIAALRLQPLLARRPANLSGGELRRVALGRALAARPRILFLDEPLSGLDPRRKSEMLEAICLACARFGIPALFVSHLRDEIHAVARRELRLRAGRVLGWAEMPACLEVDIISRENDRAVLDLGGHPVSMALPDAAGRRARVCFPDASYLLSAQSPGPSTGIATLPVKVLEPAGQGAVTVVLGGQKLTLQGPADLPDIAAGTRLYLTLQNVTVSNLFDGM